MTLRITAEDGTTKEYAIKQKNEYNWTKDFINGQQGNVWFGQMKDGSGDWANMTSVDKDGWYQTGLLIHIMDLVLMMISM